MRTLFVSLLLLASYTAQSTALPKKLLLVENQGCGSPTVLFDIYEGDDHSKSVGKIEIIKTNEETIRQFVTSDGVVAKTETDSARPNVAVIRNAKNETINRILSEHIQSPMTAGVLRFSLISAEARKTASIGLIPFSSSIRVDSKESNDHLLYAVQDQAGSWTVQIRESAEADALSLIMLLAWYRSQYYDLCALGSFLLQTAHRAAPFVLVAIGLTGYMSWHYKREQAASVI